MDSESSLCWASQIVGWTLTFILSEVGAMKSSEQRDVTWGIVVRQFLCCYIYISELSVLSHAGPRVGFRLFVTGAP